MPVKVSFTIDTMLNFDDDFYRHDDGSGTCKLTVSGQPVGSMDHRTRTASPGMEYQWFAERYQHFTGSDRRLAERMDQLEGLVKKIAGPGGIKV